MRQKDFKEKRVHVKTEKKLGKTHYSILIGFMTLSCLHYIYLEPQTIGHDTRYNIYAFWMPVIIGILALGYYRRDFLLTKYAVSKGIGLKLFIIGFYLLQGVFISFFSFGFVANVLWNYANKKVAEQNPTEIIACRIDKFIFKSNEGIFFKYQNRFEKIPVSYQSIKEYRNEKPSNYDIKLTVQKGIWNYYIVKNWTIEHLDTLTQNNKALEDSNAVTEQICEHSDLSKKFDFKTKISRYEREEGFDSCTVELTITEKVSKRIVQVIKYSSTYFFENVFANCNSCRSYQTGKNEKEQEIDNDYGDIIVADFNFDRKEDIAIKHDSGGNGGPSYDFYIQDSKSIFHLDTYLSHTMVYFPTYINPTKKTLITIVHANAAQMSEITYKLSSNKDKWEKIKHKFIDAVE